MELMRFWYEIRFKDIGLGFTSAEMTITAPQKWFPYNKGGEPRKWYGNNDYVVNWQNDGYEVKQFVASKYVSYSRTVKNIPYYFRKGLTWSAIAKKYAVRAYNEGFIFADKGQACFVEESSYYYASHAANASATVAAPRTSGCRVKSQEVSKESQSSFDVVILAFTRVSMSPL